MSKINYSTLKISTNNYVAVYQGDKKQNGEYVSNWKVINFIAGKRQDPFYMTGDPNYIIRRLDEITEGLPCTK